VAFGLVATCSPARIRMKLASRPGLVAGPVVMPKFADRSSGMMPVPAPAYSSRLNLVMGTLVV
jgi:hypothetical protein